MINLSKEMINSITSQYGDAVYIFNKDEFEKNYRELESTFRQEYSNYHICYSYKTNYTPAICKCVKDLGGYAEVVSDMEYRLALELGYQPQKIVFNGPIKGKYLEKHLLSGGINNIDRIEEARYICEISEKNPHVGIKTGIRVNFDVDAGYTSRFGIDINKLGQIMEPLKKHNVIVNGLHCHMSRARGIEPWKLRAKTMLDLIKSHDLKDIEYISLGSGMYGKMDPELKVQFPIDAPDYKEYAEGVIRQFAEFYKEKNKKPILFTEPGTTIVSKYVDFLGKIIGIKNIRENEFVLLNCSFHNLGETCQMKNLPIKIYHSGEETVNIEKAKFVGYTCLEQDIVYRDYTGEIANGDYVLFGNVGGYSLVDKPPFIMPDYPMISIDKNKKIKLIKQRESFEDIFSKFLFEE